VTVADWMWEGPLFKQFESPDRVFSGIRVALPGCCNAFEDRHFL
jgi:hypothetical protein